MTYEKQKDFGAQVQGVPTSFRFVKMETNFHEFFRLFVFCEIAV